MTVAETQAGTTGGWQGEVGIACIFITPRLDADCSPTSFRVFLDHQGNGGA
jgi:hypothetical protein